MRGLQRLKSLDFYKKLPSDLTEATLTGGGLSIIATIVMTLLLVLELQAFLRGSSTTEMMVDRSVQGELLRISFNISFPSLSCEHLTLDVSDALGTKRINLTKTVRKLPIDSAQQRAGYAIRDEPMPEPKYDEVVDLTDDQLSVPLSTDVFQNALRQYPIVIANFYAPWCPWCQKLEPAWEAATKQIHDKYPEHDGRIRLAKVDCTQEVELCRQHKITGFPSIRVYRKGSDDVVIGGFHEHEAYHGDRSVEALVAFAEELIPSAGNPHAWTRSTRRLSLSEGCLMNGFLLVKKVPGTLHFHAKSPSTSFDYGAMNMSHIVHAFTYGAPPSPRKLSSLKRLHPGGLQSDWEDKYSGRVFSSEAASAIYEHYMQVVLTTVEPRSGAARDRYDAYEYTLHSHVYSSEVGIPAAKFSYETSPIQVVVREQPRAYYHFITTTCAIIGGVFTVLGLIDGVIYQSYKLAKKIDLGKQG